MIEALEAWSREKLGLLSRSVTFRKKIYGSLAELQVDLDAWLRSYNEAR